MRKFFKHIFLIRSTFNSSDIVGFIFIFSGWKIVVISLLNHSMRRWQFVDNLKGWNLLIFGDDGLHSYVFVNLRAKPLHLCVISDLLFFIKSIYHIITIGCDASGSGMVIAEDFIEAICIFGWIVDINQFFVFQIMFIWYKRLKTKRIVFLKEALI